MAELLPIAPSWGWRAALVVALGAGAVASAWVGASVGVVDAPPPEAPSWNYSAAAEVRPRGFASVAEKLGPSVVRITTTQAASAGLGPFEGTPFERFFDGYGGLEPQEPSPQMGMGSGVVIDERGHVLTNYHVVAGAQQVRVTFADGEELNGEVVGSDPKTDLAVLRVDGSTAPAAPFGDASSLRVGEWVMAIGNPFGLDHSVTVGVLSAKGRHGFAPGQLEDFLQTDASINPGNSGGPLVNLDGEVIGINTMIVGMGTGVGLAVSASIARPIAKQLIEHGKVTRPYIGLIMQTVTPELQRALGDDAPDGGALVAEVQRGSPAEKAGIEVGDIVVAVDGTPAEDSHAVQQRVLDKQVGENARLEVWRDGRRRRFEVATTELPGETTAAAPTKSDDEVDVGLQLQTLTPEVASRLGLEATDHGAVVVGVVPASGAARAGLRPGDVILGVDGAAIASAEEAAEHLQQERRGGHLLRLRRGPATLFVVIAPPSP